MFKSLILGLSIGTMALAQGANADSLNINSKASKVEWVGKKVLVDSQHNGTIAVKNGFLKFKGKSLVGGEVIIDMKSIVNLDLTDKKWNKKLVGHLSSEDFFHVAKHPTSKLVIKSLKKMKGKYVLNGDLTIRGVTKAVTADAKLKKSADSASLTATLLVDRTEFNVKYGSGKFFTGLGDKVIADTFEVKAKIVVDGSKKSSSL